MAESEMLKVLRKVGLLHVWEMFEKEKITPNIVSMLLKHELEYLGVTIPAHTCMMTLRMECIKYGNKKPVKMDDCDSKISDIGNLLQLLERTIYRRMAHFGLQKRDFSDIDDDNLDNILSGIVVDFPRCGERMLREILKGKGIKVQKWRLRDS
ncbi:unnamed protein product [Mytilus coruscus]|uniref:SAM domain-containing protein n=1 Tax=Mytilus coruscus TaxID=42192 RepID=A0A6J8ED05_MYTCO|nr:unnamed protein product [Mytilus coruscus]